MALRYGTFQLRTQDFEKGGGGGAGNSENLRTQIRTKFFSIKFSPIFCPKLGEDLKKRSSLKFSPIFCPKLGEGHKQNSLPTLCVIKASALLTKGGGHAEILHRTTIQC